MILLLVVFIVFTMGVDGKPANKKVNGNWGAWISWTRCSKSCGDGQRHRERHCNNPSPSNEGRFCLLSDRDQEKFKLVETVTETCNNHCKAIGPWASWSHCTCKKVQYSKRNCQNKPDCVPTKSRSCSPKGCGGGSTKEECFPSDALVRNNKGLKIAMKDLKIGEKVLTMGSSGRPVYSEVTMMLHRDINRTTEFVTIATRDGRHLSLTSYHLIPLSTKNFIFAKDLVPGHVITIFDATQNGFNTTQVTSVGSVTKTGTYAPLSMEGTLIVDDVYVSCYAVFPSHTISHLFFSLWRGLYSNFNSLVSSTTSAEGIHWYPSMLISAATYVKLMS